MKNERGFTLIELFVVIAIIGIMAGMAIPSFMGAMQNAIYRDEARTLGSMFREARSRTVSLNLEHRVRIDLTASANTYRLEQGNASSGSTTWSTIVSDRGLVPTTVVLAQAGCAGAAPIFVVSFNPNGSAESGCVIDVRDTAAAVRYQITVTQNTGRVRIS